MRTNDTPKAFGVRFAIIRLIRVRIYMTEKVRLTKFVSCVG